MNFPERHLDAPRIIWEVQKDWKSTFQNFLESSKNLEYR